MADSKSAPVSASLSHNEISLIAAILKHNSNQIKVDWDLVGADSTYTSASASVTWRKLKKKLEGISSTSPQSSPSKSTSNGVDKSSPGHKGTTSPRKATDAKATKPEVGRGRTRKMKSLKDATTIKSEEDINHEGSGEQEHEQESIDIIKAEKEDN